MKIGIVHSHHDHDHPHHDHSRHRGHAHTHDHGLSGRLGLAFFLNLAFALIELVGGAMTNSMAVLSDALHDLGDAVALGIAWWLEKKSLQRSDLSFTYGYRRLSLASAVGTGVILVSGSLWIIAQAIPRLINPQPVNATGMMGLAVLGVIVNGFAFWRLSRGSSVNETMLRWHFIEDMMGWVLVLVGSLIMMVKNLPWLDPLMALVLSIWVLRNVVRHLWRAIVVFLQATPEHLRQGQAEKWMRAVGGVLDVHHTHIWSLDGDVHILTSHVVVEGGRSLSEIEKIKKEIKQGLKNEFQIAEATIEIESSEVPCADPQH